MLKEIIIAIQSYAEAHSFIHKHNLWRWILVPGIIYMLLFCTGMYFFVSSANNAVSWMGRASGLEAWLQGQRSEWLSFIFVMIGLMLRLVLFLLYFSLFKYLFLIIGSPVFAYLSEKTESILEGRDFPFSATQLAKDSWQGIKLAVRNTFWQTFYLLTLMLFSFIPVIGWIAPMIAIFVECFYYGFSMLAYSCERHRLTHTQSIQFVKHHRGLAVGNGFLFYLMHALPFVGWVLAPAYAVVAATLSVLKIRKS